MNQTKRQIAQMLTQQAQGIKKELITSVQEVNGIKLLASRLPFEDTNVVKDLAYQLEKEIGEVVIVFGCEVKAKPQLMVTISKQLVEAKSLDAGKIIRELAKEIKGGGGGQAFFATAGGNDLGGLDRAINKAKEII